MACPFGPNKDPRTDYVCISFSHSAPILRHLLATRPNFSTLQFVPPTSNGILKNFLSTTRGTQGKDTLLDLSHKTWKTIYRIWFENVCRMKGRVKIFFKMFLKAFKIVKIAPLTNKRLIGITGQN